MFTNKANQTLEKQSAVSPVVAAVTGVAVGAGLATVGIMAMKNDKNKEKVKKVINTVKSKASNYLKKTEKQVDEGKKKLVKTVAAAKKSAKM